MINILTNREIRYISNTNRYLSNVPSNANLISILNCSYTASYSNLYGLFNFTTKDIYDKIKPNVINSTNINQSSTLFFDKSCKFPRFKLQDTKFKRCIKLDKADYIVISNFLDMNDYTFSTPYEYMIEYDDKEYYFPKAVNDRFDSLKSISKKVEVKSLLCINKLSHKDTILEIINNYNKPFVYDNDLDLLISKQGENIDEETLLSIYDMLNSTDPDSVELGCKLLASFNVYDVKLAVSMLLYLTQKRWMPNKASKSVSFSSMLDNIGYPHSGHYSIDRVFESIPFQSENDKVLTKVLIVPWINKIIEDNGNFEIQKCPFKININIEVE